MTKEKYIYAVKRDNWSCGIHFNFGKNYIKNYIKNIINRAVSINMKIDIII